MAVAGFANLLEKERGNELDPDARFYLSRIASNTAQLERMLRSVLEFSRCGSTPTAREPFERLPQARELNPEGVGMGLVIARRIVELHSGEIWLESRPGSGTIAFFTLPKTGSRSAPGRNDGPISWFAP